MGGSCGSEVDVTCCSQHHRVQFPGTVYRGSTASQQASHRGMIFPLLQTSQLLGVYCNLHKSLYFVYDFFIFGYSSVQFSGSQLF